MRKKTLVVLCVCIIIASLVLFSRWVESGKVDASDKSKMVQIQDSVKYQRYREVMQKKAVFAKGRQMLLDKNVPFDPDFLIRPKGAKVLLDKYFPKMAEMQSTLTVRGELQGVYMADTLYLPEHAIIAGPTVILVRNLVFEGQAPSITGIGPSYIFPLVSIKKRVMDNASHGYVYLSAPCVDINHNGRNPGYIGTEGASPGVTNPQTSTLPKADDGVCQTGQEANGRPGDTGDMGGRGADAGKGGRGGKGDNATPIYLTIPDGADTGATCRLSAKGARGGQGGPGGIGGRGGTGGQGGEGGDGASCCNSLGVRGAGGPGGRGGKGGTGGIGGTGGPGGEGGDGAAIVVDVPYGYDASGIDMDGAAGQDGLGGDGKPPGQGGEGGDPGDKGKPGGTGTCTLQTTGNGTKGPSGDIGPRGGDAGDDSPTHGMSVAPVLTHRGRDETDLDEDGYSPSEGDCNDNDSSCYPGAPTLPCSALGAVPWTDQNCNGTPDLSECSDPIIINFYDPLTLTSVDNGVIFDINGTGKPVKISWTRPHADDGFLAIDLNGNGRIDDGNELFGNNSVVINGKIASNGFEALAWYDQPANGGNGDGYIGSRDSIYHQLLIWRDVNHNGRSEVGELFSLPDLNVGKISLAYENRLNLDQYGNDLSIRSISVGSNFSSRQDLRFIYDVYLVRSQ